LARPFILGAFTVDIRAVTIKSIKLASSASKL